MAHPEKPQCQVDLALGPHELLCSQLAMKEDASGQSVSLETVGVGGAGPALLRF